jgi:hypothetical protein
MTAVPMPVPVVAPADLLWLETLNLVLAGDRRTGSLICGQPFIFRKRMRRKRRSRRTCRQRRSACGSSNGNFQKVTAFHDISLFVRGE